MCAEKRAALEEQLWSVLEGDIGDCFETYEAAKVGKDGKLRDRWGRQDAKPCASSDRVCPICHRARAGRRSRRRRAAALFQARRHGRRPCCRDFSPSRRGDILGLETRCLPHGIFLRFIRWTAIRGRGDPGSPANAGIRSS
jgi:hypothetical protein